MLDMITHPKIKDLPNRTTGTPDERNLTDKTQRNDINRNCPLAGNGISTGNDQVGFRANGGKMNIDKLSKMSAPASRSAGAVEETTYDI